MIRTLIIICSLIACTSCSVAMAARKEGTSVEKIQGCRSRGQMIAAGAQIISSERNYTGNLVEVYQFQKERGSAARALMHGVLDVSTCGLWEVVGTPIEATVDQKSYFSIRVTYDMNENVQNVELM